MVAAMASQRRVISARAGPMRWAPKKRGVQRALRASWMMKSVRGRFWAGQPPRFQTSHAAMPMRV